MNKNLTQIIHDLTGTQIDKLMEIMDRNDWNVTKALTEKLSEIMAV